MSVAALLAAARARGTRIATAESCTGGMIAAALTDVAGASDVFECGFVSYSNAAKQAMLGVRAATLAAQGAVSEAVAGEMAAGALARSAATLAVSATGIAGPGGSEFKPEGRVCFGLAQQGQPTQTETVEFGALGRNEVRRATLAHALALLMAALTRVRTAPPLATKHGIASQPVTSDTGPVMQEGRMIEISPSKLVQIIFQAREGRVAEAELRAFIAGLNEDESAHLVALAWVGRGAFEPEEYDEAVETARSEASTPTADYLMGMPHLAENLEAGLEAMGIDVTGEEEDLL